MVARQAITLPSYPIVRPDRPVNGRQPNFAGDRRGSSAAVIFDGGFVLRSPVVAVSYPGIEAPSVAASTRARPLTAKGDTGPMRGDRAIRFWAGTD
jgi:hypothetical protein